MARRKLHETRVGRRCTVKIYRDPDSDEYVVKAFIDGKVKGEAFESDMQAARGTAAAEARWLRRQTPCR